MFWGMNRSSGTMWRTVLFDIIINISICTGGLDETQTPFGWYIHWCFAAEGNAGSPQGQKRRQSFRCGNTRRLRSEEHTSELQSHSDLVCRLLLEKKNKKT